MDTITNSSKILFTRVSSVVMIIHIKFFSRYFVLRERCWLMTFLASWLKTWIMLFHMFVWSFPCCKQLLTHITISWEYTVFIFSLCFAILRSFSSFSDWKDDKQTYKVSVDCSELTGLLLKCSVSFDFNP